MNGATSCLALSIAMSVRIQLDKPHAHFTNLDAISGRVILSILSPETISNINVKLEGESRSRLAGYVNPRGAYDPYERDQTQLEVHKVSEYLPDTVLAGWWSLTISTATLQSLHCLPNPGSTGIWRQ